MDQNEERIGRLLEGYQNKALSPAERMELFTAISQDESLLSRFADKLPLSFTESIPVNADSRQEILAAIFSIGEEKPAAHRVHFLYQWRWTAAAAIALLIVGAYFWLRTAPQREIAVAPVTDVQPGRDKAILTLADGSAVTLDTAGRQVIQQGTTVLHEQNGQLKYDVQGSPATIAYNTLATPRGGQFRVTLPDGTAVWLNTASSLRYPTAFAGKERKVEVTGEAYFEVAKDAAKPFIVKINEQTEIQVLGTHFNVNAYPDEATINTTLLEGAVDVRTAQHTQKLAPGQQARVNAAGGGIRLADNVNTGQAIAWKNGIFDFNQADIKTVMRQIGRWYDVEIVYEKGVEIQDNFVGEMQRSLTLAQVLKGLENMGLKFRIDNGKRLIVMPS